MPSAAAASFAACSASRLDPQQLRLLAVEPQDVVAAAESHPEVAVGDATLQRERLDFDRTQPGLEVVHDVHELLHRCRSPLPDKARNLYLLVS